MADNKLELNALGIYFVGYSLERLEWAIATISNAAKLAPYFALLRGYEKVRFLEDIGVEAKYYDDKLSSYGDQEIPVEIRGELRDARARWDTLVRERLSDLYLVTPRTKIGPKYLMYGIVGFLPQDCFASLEQIEASDLNEACRCILIGSATAGEHIALRAAESLLRRWYEHKTNKKLRYETWGKVLDKLVQEYPENVRPKEITLLGYLKQRRDEVAHPQRVSRLTEAETTLMNVCSLIEDIQPVLLMPVASLLPVLEAPKNQKKANSEKSEGER
jgi:hypothetical protein